MSETTTTQPGAVLTIGYGNRSWEQMAELLKMNRVDCLVDVRSRPTSANKAFTREMLEHECRAISINYMFMGDKLGGKASHLPATKDGHADYRAIEGLPEFQNGLGRVHRLAQRGHIIALMCAELRPDACHRTKLIGEAFARHGIGLVHVDADGSLLTQQQVVNRVNKGQTTLQGTKAFLDTSRGKIL